MKSIGIVGTGPAGLMAGLELLKSGHDVQFFDQKKTAGRKFLVAGEGGFNLSNSLEINEFVSKYNHSFIKIAVEKFSNKDAVLMLKELGIETFVGSSGKIFPKKGIKPIDVVSAIVNKIKELGGNFNFEYTLKSFQANQLTFIHKNRERTVRFDEVIFSLGGSSWGKTGSDGKWCKMFMDLNIQIVPFESSNAGVEIQNWNSVLKGTILKNCSAKIDDEQIKGELLFTEYGIEGPPIYALNASIRLGAETVFVDLKPSLTEEKILSVLQNGNFNRTEQLTQLKINRKIIRHLKLSVSKEEFLNNDFLAEYIKHLPFQLGKLRPIDEAISTVGGISMEEIDSNFELKKLENHYCVGEMLDWDAPTGGFLLQACFSTGMAAARAVSQKN